MHNAPRRKTISHKLPSNEKKKQKNKKPAHHVVALTQLNAIPLMLFRTNRLRTN